MRIQKQVVEHVTVGNLRLSIDYTPTGKVDDVAVQVTDGEYTRFTCDAEVIERVALILQTRRLATGDQSYVCPRCGYVPGGHDCESEGKEMIR